MPPTPAIVRIASVLLARGGRIRLPAARRHGPVGQLKSKWFALALLGSLITRLFSAATAAQADSSLEYQVKAGYLINFARFVEWPTSALPQKDSPFVIGVLDRNDAGPAMKAIVGVLGGRPVNGREVKVVAVPPETKATHVHILFVTRSAQKNPEELHSLIAKAPVLLVGETDQFAERGGTIGFTRDGENIRLNLNLDRANQAGLKVSSKLASVARLVNPTAAAAK